MRRDVRFTPIADIGQRGLDVCFGPIGDISLRGDAACGQFCFVSGLSLDAVGRTSWNSAPLLPSDDAVS